MPLKRDSHQMTLTNWAALASIAQANGCASWRVLLRRIAVGELVVVSPVGTILVPGLIPAAPSASSLAARRNAETRKT